MNYKQRAGRNPYGVLSISGYKDLDRVNSSVKRIHFRKFVSRKLLKLVLELAPNVKSVSFSKYAISRAKEAELEYLRQRGVQVRVSGRVGRPNIIEMVVL